MILLIYFKKREQKFCMIWDDFRCKSNQGNLKRIKLELVRNISWTFLKWKLKQTQMSHIYVNSFVKPIALLTLDQSWTHFKIKILLILKKLLFQDKALIQELLDLQETSFLQFHKRKMRRLIFLKTCFLLLKKSSHRRLLYRKSISMWAQCSQLKQKLWEQVMKSDQVQRKSLHLIRMLDLPQSD